MKRRPVTRFRISANPVLPLVKRHFPPIVAENVVDDGQKYAIMLLVVDSTDHQGLRTLNEILRCFNQAMSRGIRARTQAMIRIGGEQGRAASQDAS